MSVARLGYEIDSSPLAEAVAGHERFVTSAGKVEQAAGRVGGAGTRMSRGFADLNPTLEKIVGSLARLDATTVSIDKRLAAIASAANNAAKANGNLDRSAIEASTAYKQLEASLNAVTAAQRKGDASLATSLSAIDKQREAIARLNAELQKLRAAPAVPGGNRPAANNNGGQAGVGNISAQLFDTFSTAPYMSATTIGLQQGPQFAQAFAGQSTKQTIASLGAGLAAVASPISLIAIGLTAAAAAAIQFGDKLFNSSSKAEEALIKHEDTLGRIKGLFDDAGSASERYSQRVQGAIQFSARSDKITLQETLQGQLRGLGNQFSTGGNRSRDNDARYRYGALYDTVKDFGVQAAQGKGDVIALNSAIDKLANEHPEDTRLQKIAKNLHETTAEALATAEAIRALNKEVERTSSLTTRTDAARNATQYQAETDYARLAMTRRYNADVSGIGARSPAERAAAERRRLEAEPIDPKEAPGNRSLRIDQQVDLMVRRAQQRAADAQRERALSLEKILEDQRTDIDLIGKTGGAAAALRKEYELTSQLRMEAARNGTEVDQKELGLIHQRTAALAPLCDPYDQTAFAAGFNIESEE